LTPTIDAIISFVVVAFVLFLIVRAYNRMRRDDPAAGPTDNELLVQIRDLLASRQP
jgi:large conductance mechanosensitive channel